jgi:hypothetical protein
MADIDTSKENIDVLIETRPLLFGDTKRKGIESIMFISPIPVKGKSAVLIFGSQDSVNWVALKADTFSTSLQSYEVKGISGTWTYIKVVISLKVGIDFAFAGFQTICNFVSRK